MNRRIAAIIRHGDYHQMRGAPSAHQPYPLTREGERHAREAADHVAGAMAMTAWQLHPVIDCSQMLRAWQTARIIAEALAGKAAAELQLESFADLAERCVGSVANLTTKRIRQILLEDPRYAEPPAGWKSNSEYRLPFQGAESLLEAGERVAAHLQQRMSGLVVDGSDTLKLFIGHGAAFRHAAYHLGVLEYGELKRLSMFHGRPVFLELLDDGSWRHVAGEWKVRESGMEFND